MAVDAGSPLPVYATEDTPKELVDKIRDRNIAKLYVVLAGRLSGIFEDW